MDEVLKDHRPEEIKLRVIEARKIMDAVAWVRKYFVAASVERGEGFLVRIGIIASMLISRPIQMSRRWELNRAMKVPESTVRIIDKLVIIFISTGRGITNIFGVWAR